MRVLIVEDEPELRAMLAEEIADLGHEIHEAASGDEGVALARSVRPHVICSDINMPGMTGHQMKARLDEEGLIDDGAVFIFLSANATRVDIAEGLMAGAAHYFTKPIDYDRLADVLADTEAALTGD